jgi:hypothetical protein
MKEDQLKSEIQSFMTISKILRFWGANVHGVFKKTIFLK